MKKIAKSIGSWSQPIVVAPEQGHRYIETQAAYACRNPSLRPGKGSPEPLIHELRAEFGRGGEMDRAVEMDVAKLVRADIKIDPVDAVAVVKVSVRRCLDLRPGGNRIGDCLERFVEFWRWSERPLGLARKSGQCLLDHEGLLA